MRISRLGVVGAGNMGSGIAQKMAAEGFDVTLVDVDDARVSRGLSAIGATLSEAVARRLIKDDEATAIQARVHGTSRFEDLAAADVVVEAVFEDFAIKRDVFQRLDGVCRSDAILATNTSSFSVTALAASTRHPERVLGLHYFFHPAKNRLVEVAPGQATSPSVVASAVRLQEALGKTAIVCRDACGFVVNRFFAPWLTHAIRLVEEGIADPVTIDEAAKDAFGIGMGPFELMNVTGVPIALHTANTLGTAFGPFYSAPEMLRRQVERAALWSLDGVADRTKFGIVADRLRAAAWLAAASLVDEGVGSIEDVDIGARVGLRWRRGPFELMNRDGVARAAGVVEDVADRWSLPLPRILARQRDAGMPFHFQFVTSATDAGVATLTIRRPDTMNALNEAVVTQLGDAFRAAAADPAVHGIVIAGAGKAFVAGADISFFIRNMQAGTLERIVEFTRHGQDLLREIERCEKPVVARLHGLALGGGVELALACRWIVATPKATLAFPETGIGIYPGLGGTQRTTRRVGANVAKWLVLTGVTLTAEQACALGLIDRVVPHTDLDTAIAALIRSGAKRPARRAEVPAEYQPVAALFGGASLDAITQTTPAPDPHVQDALKRLAWKAPIASRLAHTLIETGADRPLDDALELEMQHLIEIFSTRDAYEGLSSLGKKRPDFQGR